MTATNMTKRWNGFHLRKCTLAPHTSSKRHNASIRHICQVRERFAFGSYPWILPRHMILKIFLLSCSFEKQSFRHRSVDGRHFGAATIEVARVLRTAWMVQAITKPDSFFSMSF